MMVFLILAGLVLTVLYKQIIVAFMANPGLNGLIIAVLVIGILLAFRPGDPPVRRSLVGQQLSPRRSGLGGRPPARFARPDGDDPRRACRPHGDFTTTMRGLMDSIATRLDEGARHLALT